MKSFGDDVEKQGVDPEEQLPLSSPPASVPLDPSSITIAGRDASSITCKNRGKSRSRPGKDDKNSSGKHISDLLHSSVSAHERTLQVKGTGKVLQGKSETNGNYVTIHPSKNIQETRHEDGFKLSRKRRPVTVDTSKAKTSLEAMKISIKQLKWKEVCCVKVSFMLFHCVLF